MIRVSYYRGTDCITPYIVENEALRLSGNESIYFVVPEYSKAQVEKMLLQVFARSFPDEVFVEGSPVDMKLSSAFTSGDVTSFIRLAQDILSTCGKTNIAPGGDVELRNAIYSVLTEYKEDFRKLAGFAGHYEYINGLINIIGDFVRYGIGPEQLREAIDASDSGNEDYLAKITDIAFLMEKLRLMNDTYDLNLMTDPIKTAADVLNELSKDPSRLDLRRFRHIRDLISSRYVFIGFGSSRLLTPHEEEFITVLSDMGADIVFYTIGDPFTGTSAAIFSVANSFIDIMRTNHEAEIEEFIPDHKDDSVVHKCVDAYIAGDKTLLPSRDEARMNVILSQISDPDDRIGYVMNEIVDLTRNKGYRYKDIRIVCCNDELMPSITSVAEVFGLDLFIDRKIDLIDTVIPMYAETILMLPLTGYSTEVVLRAMYSGMMRIAPYLADAFDNYCRLKAIKDGKRLFSEIFYRKNEDDEDKDGKAGINKNDPEVYVYNGTVEINGEVLKEGSYPAGDIFWDYVILDKLRPLKKVADEIYACPTLSSKAKLLAGFLDSNRLFIESLRDELLSQKMDTAALALVRGYDEIMKLLASFSHEMNDVPISQSAMISLIRTDMKNKTEGTIPLRVDSVEITTPSRAFISPCKVLFIVGADRSNFPSGRVSDGIISSEELKTLAGSLKDISLPDKTESSIKEQYVSSCLMMGTATDLIYMVHEYGKPMSRVFDFLRLHEEGEDWKIPVNNYRFMPYEDPVEKRFFFENASISEGNMAVFAGTKMKCSVSALEQFNNCHFQYMAERIIKAREREDNTEVRANVIGTVIHAMFENAIRDIGLKTGADLEDYCGRFIQDGIFNEEELSRLTDVSFRASVNPKEVPSAYDSEGSSDILFDNREGRKIKRIFRWMYPEVMKECNKSGYVPSGFELELGKGDYEFNITASNGMTFMFRGFIDRYDIRKEDGTNSVRVVDYKTGKKSVSMAELVEGTQIQLPVYSYVLMQGLSADGDYNLSNYGYLPVNMGTGKNEELKLKPSMLIDEGKTTGKTGELNKMLSDNIGILSSFAIKSVRNSCDAIAQGKADANVSARGKCDYCKYRGLCGNNASRPARRAASGLIPEGSSLRSLDGVMDLITNIREYMDGEDQE